MSPSQPIREKQGQERPFSIAHLWLLRALHVCDYLNQVDAQHANFGASVFKALDLSPHFANCPAMEISHEMLARKVAEIYPTAEAQLDAYPMPEILASNLEKIAGIFKLTPNETQILAFCILVFLSPQLSFMNGYFDWPNKAKIHHDLSLILDLPSEQIRTALDKEGRLHQSGLLRCNNNGKPVAVGTALHEAAITLDSNDFCFNLYYSTESDPYLLLEGWVTSAPTAQLSLDHYSHIQTELDIALPLLRHALDTAKLGTNIYIYGAPGTGKTELVRVLAAELGVRLFETVFTGEGEEPIGAKWRLNHLRLGQIAFGGSASLIVFDEAEDVFDDGMSLLGDKSSAASSKAWTNRLLEENASPTIWLSNGCCLDPAFVRRFDMVFELPVPPKKEREKIIAQHAAGLISEAQVQGLAAVEELAPAVVTKVSATIHAIKNQLPTDKVQQVFEQLIGNTLKAQGHRTLQARDADKLPEVYDPHFINASADLSQISAGLMRAQHGRLCLYGPPGTGKTAYARWLADYLEKPLHIQRASDLLSKWLGESERNIAKAFRQAQKEGAVLLIDEVDSFLQDRRYSDQAYEQRMVNEMLTQMECFPGIFIASTNLMQDLDPAVLRRFDLKAQFGYLQTEQAWRLLQGYCASMKLPAPSAAEQSQMMRLENLTPGDFSAVQRRHQFAPLANPTALVTALQEECRLKEQRSSTIGFVSCQAS